MQCIGHASTGAAASCVLFGVSLPHRRVDISLELQNTWALWRRRHLLVLSCGKRWMIISWGIATSLIPRRADATAIERRPLPVEARQVSAQPLVPPAQA